MSVNHPDRQSLFAFGQGLTNPEESHRIEQHLQECATCCETLVDLKDDTFVGLVRSVHASIADTGCDQSPVGDKQTGHQGKSSDSFAPTIVELSHSESTPIASVEDWLPELTGHPRYRIIAPVGRGGMGSVYKAEHRLMQRSAAIKVINPELIRHPLAVERFRREVRAAAKLSHPNIVAAWDAEQAGNLHLLVMEFVDGTDLATVVQQRGPLDVSQACDYIAQAARGLQHAYEKGMVHRDIKPHNLMLTPDGRVRILDFGLAGIVSDDDKTLPESAEGHSPSNTAGHLTSIGSVMGTPDYMAPEQAVDAHSADIRADIYSLGCTLCFLLTGQPPFEAGGVAEKLTAHAQKVPQQLSERRKDVPIALSKVADRLLAKKPEDRFQTPAEVVAALEPFTQAGQSGQRLAGRWIAAALAGFFLLFAAIIIVVTDRGRLEIQSEVDDVKIVVKKDGKQVEIFDLKTGSQMKWVPGGEYELEVVGSSNDVKLDKAGFTMSRLGQIIVTAKWSSEGSGVIRSFSATDDPITQDGISVDDGGWKIVATTPGTVQLFEIPDPNLADGPFFFRAKLRTNNLVGRAYLEMRNRIPNQSEFFSKGLQSALSGTNDWAEYEIPFFLKNGDQPDLVKLNVTIEGTGTVWIKDLELRGKLLSPAETDREQLQGRWIARSIKAGNGEMPAGAVPQWTMTFHGASIQITSPTGSNEGTYVLDESREPKEIDIKPASGAGLVRGIYRFVDDELEVCIEDSDRKRPVHWDVDAGTRQMLIRLHRAAGDPPREVTDMGSISEPPAHQQYEAAVMAYLNNPLNNTGGVVPVALLGHNGRIAFRFGTWRVIFEGIACDPKVGILGFSAFNVPMKGSKGEGTLDFGAGERLPGVLIRYKFGDEGNEISINNNRFKLSGKATRLEFVDTAYDAKNALQTIIVARDGSTKLETPKASDDPAAAPASPEANLLTDPSFENTGLTQLPNGWRAWLNDGPEFRCEVVAGGHTGQRCLQISGKGTRGVVFANDLKVDRSKRYALKGWAKFEGDQSARAIIKLNYFRGSEFLGVHDLVGAIADQGWQYFEKTDSLDAFPTADHFYAMCHVEGSGTGWFDDLELVAYDRDTLPEDFDLRHGRHNRQHGPNSLHRWVGTWRTEYAFREFDNSPTETKLTMTKTSERTLGAYFLMSHAKAEPVAPQDRRPTPADPPSDVAILGGEERLSLLFFDQNLGAFRQWDFSSNGKAFEWRGLWDNDRQTLELRMLPDASNLHSSEHFIDGDHIEGKLRFQYVMGQRDAGRWTATRTAFGGTVDLPIAQTHVASPAELSQLNKFVGEWDLHAAYRPSIWNPQQREERARESSQWILGGRFVMTRSFNEKDELTSIWIATCDPSEKSNRLWSFRADGSSSESRLTWDEAASGFQFRAIDMPSGWTGTGFNHWVDADSFDNTAIIKDENGRVLLDMTQARRRRK